MLEKGEEVPPTARKAWKAIAFHQKDDDNERVFSILPSFRNSISVPSFFGKIKCVQQNYLDHE